MDKVLRCLNQNLQAISRFFSINIFIFILFFYFYFAIFNFFFKRYYAIDVRVVFTSFKVQNYFSLKCRTPFTPLPLLANVIYKFKCLCDTNKIYIDKTMCHLVTRVKVHGNSQSAIHEHLLSCQNCKLNFSHSCFDVVNSGKNNFETTAKEDLHIKLKKPMLNKQLFSFVLNLF